MSLLAKSSKLASRASNCSSNASAYVTYALLLLFFSFGINICSADDSESTVKPSASSLTSSDWNLEQKLSQTETLRQFRVDNTVELSQNERKVSFESSTIFYDDYVFDFVGTMARLSCILLSSISFNYSIQFAAFVQNSI